MSYGKYKALQYEERMKHGPVAPIVSEEELPEEKPPVKKLPMEYPPRICKHCGKEYIGSGRSYCTYECYQDAARERDRLYKMEQRKRAKLAAALRCRNCGAPIPLDHRTKTQTCSERCARYWRRHGQSKADWEAQKENRMRRAMENPTLPVKV